MFRSTRAAVDLETTRSFASSSSSSRLPATMMFVPSSDCWLEALQGIQQQQQQQRHGGSTHDSYRNQNHNDNHNSHQDGMAADACGWMNTHHQKLLALELAWCHISDLGRRLFRRDDDDPEDDSSSSTRPEDHEAVSCSNNYSNHLGYCLTRLTPSAETAYTHFLTYIHQLCIRLSKEVVMNHFYQTSVKLSQTVTLAEERMRLLVQQQQEVGSNWKNQHEERVLLQQEWQRTVDLDRVQWAEETRVMHRQRKEQQEQWLGELEAFQQARLQERTEQQLELKRQRDEMMEQMSHTITTWAQKQTLVPPWSVLDRLHSWYQSAQIVSRVVGIMFHMVATLLVVRVLTYPSCLQWLWRLLSAWILLGGLVELLALLCRWSDNASTTPRMGDTFILEEGLSHSIRGMIWMFGATFYALGILISPCCYWRRMSHHDDRHDMDEDHDNAGIIGQHSPPALVGIVRRSTELLENKARPQAESFSPLHLAHPSWQQQVASYPPGSMCHVVPPAFLGNVPAQQCYHSSRMVASQPQYNNSQVAPFQPMSPIHPQQLTKTSAAQEHDDCEAVERSDSFSQSKFEDAKDTSDSNSLGSWTMRDVQRPTISNNVSLVQVRGLCMDDNDSMVEDEDSASLPSRKRRLLEEGTTNVNDESSIRDYHNDDNKDEDGVRSSTHHSVKRTRLCKDERKTDTTHGGHKASS